MIRTIPLKIQNEYITGDKGMIGAAGSHNDVILRMEFSGMWDGLTKMVQFRDALGEATIEVLLTADMLEADDTSVYLVPVPNGAKKYAGEMTLCIKGAAVSAQKETRATLAVYGRFTVAESKWSADAETEADVPATNVERLQGQIDNVLATIVDARKAATEAAKSAEGAALSQSHAQTSEQYAADYAQDAADSAAAAANSAASASSSATAAANSATAAKASEDAAANSATNASASATSAGKSAANAANSASAASSKADDAIAAASDAQAAKNKAADSQVAAKLSEDNAAASSTSAGKSASAAASSAAKAANYNSGAQSSANRAATSATNAASSERNAASSAATANSAKYSAESAADNAAGSQSAAKQSENNTKTYESRASSSASSAQSSATQARTYASSAQESIKHAPRISSSGKWELWDATQGAYVATEYTAIGKDGTRWWTYAYLVANMSGNLLIDKRYLPAAVVGDYVLGTKNDSGVVYTITGETESGDSWVVKRECILKGAAGTDGTTPHIGDNGNWYIGSTDTGVKAAGTDYVLTAADKSEIAALVLAEIPDGDEVAYG